MYSIYQENKDLVLMGGYTKGQNEEIDLAMECWPKICELLKQDYNTKSDFKDCFVKLNNIVKKMKHKKYDILAKLKQIKKVN